MSEKEMLTVFVCEIWVGRVFFLFKLCNNSRKKSWSWFVLV